nr:hypothetical protein [Nostoc sp. EkiNYC01]
MSPTLNVGFWSIFMLCDRTLARRVFDHETSLAIGSASLSFNFWQSFPLSHKFMVGKAYSISKCPDRGLEYG